MTQPLLWLDMTISVHDPGTHRDFERFFAVHRFTALSSIQTAVETLQPCVAVFDFDFPTKRGLNMLREMKRSVPSLPLIMCTVQHSEALAVWAFRERVWDYLVKPLRRAEVERCMSALADMLALRDARSAPRAVVERGSAIPEEHRADALPAQDSLALAPAISYVEQNFRDKTSSGQAAALCGLSPFQFSRAFKECYAVTFQEYVLRFRIREACRLLKNPAAQVADVAELVGFNDTSYFCKIFKRYAGMSPSRFSATASSIDPEALLGATASNADLDTLLTDDGPEHPTTEAR